MGAVAKTTLVAGLGETSTGDEAVGLRVVQALNKYRLPDHVEVFEGSGASDLTELFAGREQIIVIDAADFEGPPGRFVELEAPDFLADRANVLHHADIRRTVAIMFLRNSIPRKLTVVGIIPSAANSGTELTDEVKQQIPAVVDNILQRIRNNHS